MPFSIEELGFIDDAVDSVMSGLDDLFSNKEERQKARNQLEKLRNNLKVQTQAHVEKMAEIAAQDRQDARNAQAKSLQKAWWVMPTIAILSFLGFFAVLFVLAFTDVSAAEQPLYIMLGTLGTIVTYITQFFFGSSQGSKDKDKRIGDALVSSKGGTNLGTASASQVDSSESKGRVQMKKVPTAKPETPDRVGW